jgi:hypothetical protein
LQFCSSLQSLPNEESTSILHHHCPQTIQQYCLHNQLTGQIQEDLQSNDSTVVADNQEIIAIKLASDGNNCHINILSKNISYPPLCIDFEGMCIEHAHGVDLCFQLNK